MKKIIFSLLFATMAFNAYSQDVLETVTKDVCSCIEAKKGKLDTSNPKMLKMQLGFCILGSYNNHTAQIDKLYGKIMQDDKAMEKFGEDVGMKMATVCPETLMSLAGSLSETDLSEVAEPEATAEVKEDLFVEGEIVSFKESEFVTIQVKDKNARVHNMLMLDYFETAPLYTNNQIKVKDKLKVSYTEIELYDPKAKEFRYYKVITALEKI